MKELFTAFVGFQKEFNGLKADSSNPFFKSKYISLDNILGTVRPILANHGLMLIQDVTGDGEFVGVKTIIAHISGEKFETETLKMRPVKNDPQGGGSAITYAKRYQLGGLLGVCETEDDDGNAASYVSKKQEKHLHVNPLEIHAKAVEYAESGDVKRCKAHIAEWKDRISEKDFKEMVSACAVHLNPSSASKGVH